MEGLVSGVEGWGEKETAGRECVREGGGIFVGVETGWMGAMEGVGIRKARSWRWGEGVFLGGR